MTRALLLVAALAACGGESRPRCAQCGMLADAAPRWQARAGAEAFDAPKCLFRWAAAQGASLEGATVTDYYGGELLEALDAYFVSGSDVLSPMGDDLVPLRSQAEMERFVRDHGGEGHRPGSIDASILSRLR